MHVSAIHVYPIKSLRGSSVQQALVCAQGLEHDRRWMLVNQAAQMITQRECTTLATFTATVESAVLRVNVPGRDDIVVPLDAGGWTDREVKVDVWGHGYVGVAAADSINTAFSEATGIECRLLSIRADVFRTKRDVAFHDDGPILMIGESSLEALNARLDVPLPMNRFRPSIVVSGAEAFEEDTWARVRIGEVTLRAVKPCLRCVITTVDQAAGLFAGPEPLRTLATFRRKDEGVAFGQYYRPESPGVAIRVSDEVSAIA